MSTTTLDKIMRVRELCEQVANAQVAGMIDDQGEPELCELVDLVHELDQAGVLAEPIVEVHVVDVVDRIDGRFYVFVDEDDAVAFEEAVDTSLGSACYRRSEVVIAHEDAHVVIDDERGWRP